MARIASVWIVGSHSIGLSSKPQWRQRWGKQERVQNTGRTKDTECIAQGDFSPETEIPF